jgi:hypothetical protein
MLKVKVTRFIPVEQMMTLEDRLFFATRAGAALSFTCKDRPWENFERVSIRLFNCGPFDLAVKEVTLTAWAFEHPVRHRSDLKLLS